MKFAIRHQSSELEKKEIRRIQGIWSKNELKIIKEINTITGLTLDTDRIICYLDSSTTHGCYGSRTIFLGIKGGIGKDDALMVIAHELFHIYSWRKIKKMGLTKSSPGNESKEEWKLAEVTAFLLTNEPSLKKYWPKAKVYLYPEIKGVFVKVKKFWKIGNIEYFLRNSYKAID